MTGTDTYLYFNGQCGAYFGMLEDQFGIRWMINFNQTQS